MPNPVFLYVVTQNEDGTVTVDNTVPDELEVGRIANPLDIIDSARKIAASIERDMIVGQITQNFHEIVGGLLPAAAPSPAAAVRDRLAKRAQESAAAATEDAQKDDPEFGA